MEIYNRYRLYHNIYSLCSLQVRYTVAIAGEPRDGLPQMEIEEVPIDLFNNGQLDEFFLTKVNRKGQVPALTSPILETPLADSLDITHYLLSRHPDLTPEGHENQCLELLKSMHDLNYFALSFPDRPKVVEGFVKAIKERLARERISEEYRDALEYKLSV
jgi:glutathione S-transferase